MIAEVIFPAAQPDEVFGFSELSRRHGDFATVGVAVRARKAAKILRDFEVVFFGSEATPLLSPSAARLELGESVAPAELARIARDVAQDMNPIDSHQGRGDTKRKQAAVLLQRLLQDMIGRAAHDRAA